MSRGRVLIVEDEPDLAWVEQFNLEAEGYEVRVAHEGRAAIEELESFAPDLLVLDVMLPHLNGWSVLARAEELPEERRPRVILVSALTGATQGSEAERFNVRWFLAKPFEMDELVRAVGEALRAA